MERTGLQRRRQAARDFLSAPFADTAIESDSKFALLVTATTASSNGTAAAPAPVWAVVNIPGWTLATGNLLDPYGSAETLLPFAYNGTCENASYCGDMQFWLFDQGNHIVPNA